MQMKLPKIWLGPPPQTPYPWQTYKNIPRTGNPPPFSSLEKILDRRMKTFPYSKKYVFSRFRFLHDAISPDSSLHDIQCVLSTGLLVFALVFVCFASLSVDFEKESADFVLGWSVSQGFLKISCLFCINVFLAIFADK